MKRFFFLIIAVGLFTSHSMAQVAKDDFAKINSTYAGAKKLSMKIKYEVFKNKNSNTAFQTETGELKKNENSKYTRIGKIETIETETYKLIVDHEDKNMSLLGAENQDKAGDEALYMVNLQQMLSLCSKVTFKKISEDQNQYTLVIPNEEYKEIQLIYNSKTFFIEKMILYYAQEQNLEEKEGGLKESPRMEISYSEFNTQPNFDDALFTSERFLEKQKGKWFGKAPYQSYKVNDQTF